MAPPHTIPQSQRLHMCMTFPDSEGYLGVRDDVYRPTSPLSSSSGQQVSFQRTYSGAPWESVVGYCRALRTGDRVFVTGTAAVADDGSVVAPGDAYAQTHRCLELIQKALADVGAELHHVTRTRIFVTDISRWEEYGRAHGDVFADHHPTTTMVEVSRLIDPEMLVEIEADAVVSPD